MCLYSEREVLEDELCNRKDNKGIKGKKEDYAKGTFGKDWSERQDGVKVGDGKGNVINLKKFIK